MVVDSLVMNQRGIGPLAGVVLIIVITLLLASVFAVGAVDMADFGTESELVQDLTNQDRVANDRYRSELIWARDNGADEITAHVVNYTIATDSDTAGNSLNSVVIEYPDGSANVSDVDERSEIVTVGIDEDQDGTIDANATGDVECCPPSDGVKVSNNGHTLTIELSGNYNLDGGDSLIVEYEAVDNPVAGDYAVTVGVNGDVSDSGMLAVEAD